MPSWAQRDLGDLNSGGEGSAKSGTRITRLRRSYTDWCFFKREIRGNPSIPRNLCTACSLIESCPMNIQAIIFDLGGVLLEWNPRNLYRRYFDRPEEMEAFLS